MDGCLWAAVETRSLIQGHVGEGIVWISLVVKRLAGLTQRRWHLWVQVQREAAKWSARAAAQQRDPRGSRKAWGVDTEKTTQPSDQRGGVVGFFMFFDLFQIGLKLHLLFRNTRLNTRLCDG